MQLLQVQDHRLCLQNGNQQLEEIAPALDSELAVLRFAEIAAEPDQAFVDLALPFLRAADPRRARPGLEPFELQNRPAKEELLDQLGLPHPAPRRFVPPNTVARGYIDLLSDLLVLGTTEPWDPDRKIRVSRKASKYPFVNLPAAHTWWKNRYTTPAALENAPGEEKGAIRGVTLEDFLLDESL